MLKNLMVFRSPIGWKPEIDQLNEKISVPNVLGHGWNIIRGGLPMVEVEGQLLLVMETQEKLIPTSVVNKEVQLRLEEFVKKTGDTDMARSKKFKRDTKETVVNELYPKAFVTSKFTKIWIDSVNGFMCIDTTSENKVSDVIKLMHASGFPAMTRLRTRYNAEASMRKLLLSDTHQEDGFCVGRSCDLVGEGQKSVKYKNESLDSQEVRDHLLTQIKRVKKLELTYAHLVNFVLHDSVHLTLSKLHLLETTQEEYDSEEARFDAEILLMASRYAELIKAIIDTLGGEYERSEGTDQENEAA